MRRWAVMRSVLLQRMMSGGLVAWSLVLLLLLLKMKQLVRLAMARQDLWERCRRDVEAAKE